MVTFIWLHLGHLSVKVPYLGHSASMQSSRSPSLRHLGPTECSDCNGKGSASVLVPAQAYLEDNAEDENAEEDVTVVSLAFYIHTSNYL